jgi:hypothetical protein
MTAVLNMLMIMMPVISSQPLLMPLPALGTNFNRQRLRRVQSRLESLHFDNDPCLDDLFLFLLRNISGFFLALCYAASDDVFFESRVACLSELFVGALYGVGGDAE